MTWVWISQVHLSVIFFFPSNKTKSDQSLSESMDEKPRFSTVWGIDWSNPALSKGQQYMVS